MEYLLVNIDIDIEIDRKDKVSRLHFSPVLYDDVDQIIVVCLKIQINWTPLYKAIEEENFEMVQLLIDHGASLDIKIEYQKQTVTPRQLLLSKGQKKSVATALNDHAKGGVDRLGYRAYSIGIYNTVKTASLPLCVGLIAQWGHGNYPNL